MPRPDKVVVGLGYMEFREGSGQEKEGVDLGSNRVHQDPKPISPAQPVSYLS